MASLNRVAEAVAGRAIDPADRPRRAVGPDHDVVEVAVADGAAGFGASLERVAFDDFHDPGRFGLGRDCRGVGALGWRGRISPGLGGRWTWPRGADQSLQIAVGELEFRWRRQKAHPEQPGYSQRHQRPNEIRPAPGCLAVGLAFREIVLLGHECSSGKTLENRNQSILNRRVGGDNESDSGGIAMEVRVTKT